MEVVMRRVVSSLQQAEEAAVAARAVAPMRIIRMRECRQGEPNNHSSQWRIFRSRQLIGFEVDANGSPIISSVRFKFQMIVFSVPSLVLVMVAYENEPPAVKEYRSI